MSWTERFGSSAVNPSDVSYLALAFSVSAVLVWPAEGGDDVLARLIDATPAGPGLSISLPDATQGSNGFDTLINNLGADTITVLDAAGGTIGTVAAGSVRYFYLRSNSTVAGTWGSLNIGSLTSSIDAATLAGLGLRAVGTSLQTAFTTTTFSAGFTISATDRAKAYVWTGGTGTLTLPLVSDLDGAFFFEIRNQGTGVLTIACSGGELIDASASIALQPTESCFVHVGPSAYYTVGRGRNAQFGFTLLVKAITGGTVTLTSTEAANVVHRYTGVLVSNAEIVLPSYVQVYYVSNQTTGAFTVTFKTAGVGTTVTVPQGQNAVLFCDGTNVINSSTTVAGISSLTLNQGSAASPSINYSGDTTTGYYQPSSGNVGITISGTQKINVNTNGIQAPSGGTAVVPSYAFLGDTNNGWWAPAADTQAWSTNGVERLRIANTVITPTIPIAPPLGAVATPSYTFTGDLNTGMWSPGADLLAFSANGLEAFRINASQQQLAFAGTNALPSYSFTGDPNTGVYRVLADVLGIATGGTLAVQVTASGAVQGLAGTSSLPQYSFIGDPDSGLYSVSADVLAVVAGAVESARFGAGTLRVNGGAYGILGTREGLTYGGGGPNSNADAFVMEANGNTGMSFLTTNTATAQILFGDTDSNAAGGIAYLHASDTFRYSANGTSMSLFSDGRFAGTNLHNTGTVTGTANQFIASGTLFTPTGFTGINVTALTPRTCQWIRVGNVVTVSGACNITTTAAATSRFSLSIPIASNLANTFELCGSFGALVAVADTMFTVSGDTTNDRAFFEFVSGGGVSREVFYTYTYVVL